MIEYLLTIFESIKQINETNNLFKIDIEFFSGDTPALQSLGGFVESVGSALFPCRECQIEKKDLSKVYQEIECNFRSMENIKESSSNINFVPNLGVKRYTRLHQYSFFNAIEMCPQDPMHIILEGVARRFIIDFFKLWIQLGRTSLLEINSRLQNFNYGHFFKKDKVILNLKEHDLLKNELIISASQMKAFLLLIPFIFYDIIDLTSQDYKIINLLRRITMISFAFEPKDHHIDALQNYIKKFIQLWDQLFGKGFPKLHFLVHLPKWIKK